MRGSSLELIAALLVLSVSVYFVEADLVFLEDLNSITIVEPPGDDVSSGDEWLGTFIGTVKATDNAVNSPLGITYGFNNNPEDPTDDSITETDTFFKIDPVTGDITMHGNKLDFEDSGTRNIKLQLIAKKSTEFIKRTSTIILGDANDNKPVFVNDSLVYFVDENTPVGVNGTKILSNIIMTDVDTVLVDGRRYLQAEVQHCINNTQITPCKDRFKLVATSLSSKRYVGDLYILKPFDYETTIGVFQVQIRVDDGLLEQTNDVFINVRDIQDLPPNWVDTSPSVTTFDNTTVGNFRFQVRAEDRDTGNRPIYYTIEQGEAEGITTTDVFMIAPRTGLITNKVDLDLEDETYFRNYDGRILRNNWPLRLKACEIIDSTSNPIVIGTTAIDCIETVVSVKIADINDNRPEHIDRQLYIYSLSEDARTGTDLTDPRINIFDRDTDLFNKYKSEFVTPSEEFSVGGTDNNPVIEVKNSNLIDFDNGPREYALTLRTYDIDDPSLSSIANIIIKIIDVNDNRPQFSQPSYNATIREDRTSGFNVIKIEATDIDSNNFGTLGIKYTLLGSYANLFTINEDTGQVEVAECATYGERPCLDYDFPPPFYTLSVRATDREGSPQGRYSTVTLIVNLLDVNDNAPVVPDYDREIVEGERFFEPELRVRATDRDSNTILAYSIENQSPNQYWAIESDTGIIYVNKPNGEGIKFLDGDVDGRFQLLVRVTDGKFITYSNVRIRVRDINDNAPYFIPSYVEVSINETTPGGTYVVQVSALDADDPTSDNGKLKYNIRSGNVGGKFQLNEDTGELYTTSDATFDYDLLRRYEMIATVNDLGQIQLSATATIVVNILDNNNKNPVIRPFLQQFSVYDNVAVGTIVGYVAATDPDFDAVLRFQFTEPKEASSDEGFVVDPNLGYDFRTLFAINPEDGSIIVNETLDSRRASLVSYGVVVYDITPDPDQQAPGSVVINIKPFNTQPPVFENFTTPIYVDEEQPTGTVIISLIAEDNNGIRKFEIIEQPDSNYFTINPNTGSVSILNRTDYDGARRVEDAYFRVIAIDTGEPELTATTSVSVIFSNINDNFPNFIDPIKRTQKSVYTARIAENSPDGTSIGTVYAFDDDWSDNNTYDQVRYNMDDDRFDVDPKTGAMFVRLRNGAVLDRETDARLNARVIAIDNPLGPQDNQNRRGASVQVTLIDENDNCPQFSNDEYRVTIFETIGRGTDILQLFSTDTDIGTNAISYYSKIAGSGTDYEDFFDVRREFGRIYVKRDLVRHTGTYLFYVTATDNLGTGCTTNTTVVVRVLQSANAPPIWVKPPIDNMTIYVLEEQYNGMVVYDVSARDEDSGVNGLVDYTFIYNGVTTQSTPDFKINRVTGMIHAEIVYDREKIDKYVLLLKATDNGETPLETTRFMTVVVLDVNDNAPVFDDNEVQVDVTENQPLGDIRQIPSATDLDLDPVIFYDIISGNEDGVFELDRTSRMLRLVKPLDRENKGIYYMDVLASNDEPDYTVIQNRRRRATDPSILTLKVVVGDINDEAPAFLQDEYYGCVSARAPYDKHIMTIQAIDRDAIGAGVVRYRVTDGNKVSNVTLFDIHPKFGVVTNKVLMRRYADSTFFVTVNARDREDIETAESANTVAKIFVNQPGNEVKLLITQNTGEVRLYQSQIQSIIEEATDLSYVCINDIQDHVVDSVGSVSTLWSDVYVTGIRRENVDGNERFVILTNTEMKNIVDRERYNRKSDFDLLYIKEVEAASSSMEIELEDQAVLIILIIIAVLIFLVLIFCIIAFLCIRAAKRQKKAMLLHKTHATPPPMMMEQPVIVEPVMYDNNAYVEEEHHVIEDEQRVIQPEPVHVQYAVVQKGPQGMQYVEDPDFGEDDQDAIVVELKDEEPQQHDVYDAEPEYRIETEVVDADRM